LIVRLGPIAMLSQGAKTRSSKRPRWRAGPRALPARLDPQRGDAGALVGLQARAHHGVGAEQVVWSTSSSGTQGHRLVRAGRRATGAAPRWPRPRSRPAVGVVVELCWREPMAPRLNARPGLRGGIRRSTSSPKATKPPACRSSWASERPARPPRRPASREDVRGARHERVPKQRRRSRPSSRGFRRERGQVDRQARLGRRGGAEGLPLAARERQLVDPCP